jgi:hypothetical protein
MSEQRTAKLVKRNSEKNASLHGESVKIDVLAEVENIARIINGANKMLARLKVALANEN